MDVAIRFVEALDAVAGAAGADPDLLPERLAHAAGTGPCLLAAESGLPVFANEEILACRWPAFHDLLVTETPLRSVLALSLHGGCRAWAGWTCTAPTSTG